MQDTTHPDRLHPFYSNFDGSVSKIHRTALTLHQVTPIVLALLKKRNDGQRFQKLRNYKKQPRSRLFRKVQNCLVRRCTTSKLFWWLCSVLFWWILFLIIFCWINKYLLFILTLPYTVLKYKREQQFTSQKLLCSSAHAHSEHHHSHVSAPYTRILSQIIVISNIGLCCYLCNIRSHVFGFHFFVP